MVYKIDNGESRVTIWQDGLQDREEELWIGRKEFLQHKQTVKPLG